MLDFASQVIARWQQVLAEVRPEKPLQSSYTIDILDIYKLILQTVVAIATRAGRAGGAARNTASTLTTPGRR
jgi:hypothetical protein